MDLLLGLAGMLASAATSSLLAGTWLAFRHARRQPPYLDAPFGLFPVSILKPLKGHDPSLRENLESFFLLDYPEYELLFSVASPSDPAKPIVAELMDRYPRIRARLVVGEVKVGVNPKVNNLVTAYEHARHDWLLISDSNVRVERDYLKRLVGHLDNGVGMVTQVVAGQQAGGVGGLLEQAYLNTFYVRGMLLAAALGRPCVVGKAMLFRRSDADRFGGLKVLGRFLAEDFMAGEAMRRLGLRVVIASDPVTQVIGYHSVRQFWNRHLRWGRIRKKQALPAFVLEGLLSAMVAVPAGALALAELLSLPTWALALGLGGIWYTCDAAVSAVVARRWLAPWAWLGREMLSIPLWIGTLLGNRVEWRGRKLTLGPSGLLEPHS